MKKLVAAVAALALVIVALATASDREDAEAAFERGDYKIVLSLAEQGDAVAEFLLGVMYAEGQGVPQDYVQAHKWYNLAAANATEKYERDEAARSREQVARKVSRMQIKEARKLAREWKPKPE